MNVRFFAVTSKANRKNEQVQGIVDCNLFCRVSSNHTALVLQFLGQSRLSSRQMISCWKHFGGTVFDLYKKKSDQDGVLLHN